VAAVMSLHKLSAGSGYTYLTRQVAAGDVKFTYAGRSLRFWQSDLDAYLAVRAIEPINPPLPR
jgi:hypothetical protein